MSGLLRRSAPATDPRELVVWTLAAAVAGLAAFGVLSAVASPSVVTSGIAPVVLLAISAWLFFSERYVLTMGVVVLYLGLLDGYVKLRTGSSLATLGRDVLLYAVVCGAALRIALRRDHVEVPPLTVGVLAWVFIVVAQLVNPVSSDVGHAVQALRPHLEFVPLFFFGYALLRSEARLRGFFVLLIVVAAVNGVVSLIQFNLTPNQLASWGPGYRDRILGVGVGGGRTFRDAITGQSHVRPFGLGSDLGFGGMCGVLAAPAIIAVLSVARRAPLSAAVAVVAAPLVIVGIATSQTRLCVVGSLVGVAVYLGLTATSRRAAAIALATAAVAAVGWVAVGQISGSGVFSRYDSISGDKAASTTIDYRKGTFALIPQYATEFPLGAGIGTVGPAGGALASSSTRQGLNGESEFTFLLVEVGVPGLLILLAVTVRVLQLGVGLRWVANPSLRSALMALTAVQVALFAGWVIGPITAGTPAAPFFWFAAGGLSYWIGEVQNGRVPTRRRFLRFALDARNGDVSARRPDPDSIEAPGIAHNAQ